MIKLYYADISGVPTVPPEGLMSEYRLRKLEKLRPELNRKQSIGAELLLNYAVKKNFPNVSLPLNIKSSVMGKPYCDNLPEYFSLSHSGNFAICAISEREIGADIQKKSPYRENLAKRQFTLEEYNYVQHSPDKDAAFTEIWSRKESCVKALGIGISLELNSFSVIPDNEIALCDKQLSVWSGNIDRYSISVCTIGKCDTMPIIIEVEL